jgi:hypothetical protein
MLAVDAGYSCKCYLPIWEDLDELVTICDTHYNIDNNLENIFKCEP